jgi:hypothetical protein
VNFHDRREQLRDQYGDHRIDSFCRGTGRAAHTRSLPITLFVPSGSIPHTYLVNSA